MNFYTKRVFDESVALANNAMLKHRLDLFYEWDFEKNDKLGLNVYKVTKGSGKKVWWNCPKCESGYDATILNRRYNSNCPYCRGYKVNHTNSLATLRPDIAKEWHPTLNGKPTPHDIVCGSNDIAWWLGECGHKWKAMINNRTRREDGCPVCSNHKILKGFNDMWTTNPELASLLLNSDDGYRYTQSSSVKVDWKCLQCKNIINNKRIADINQKGLSCQRCSDGVSFGEKFIYNLLTEFHVDFTHEKTFEWSDGKRYDFYLPKYNWIVEVHGNQHYEKDFSSLGGKSLKEEQENDRLKAHLAKGNNISNYIVIDVRNSTLENMKNSISNSDLMSMFPEVDFVRVGQLTNNSLVREACKIWNSGVHSLVEIATIMNLADNTVRNYLKRGAEIGWCDYTSSTRKPIVQLDSDMNFLRSWESTTEATSALNVNNISKNLSGRSKTAGGFIWMHKEDYENSLVRRTALSGRI